ncbi:MAG: adenylate/guanylate cyclase domain-containing protein, partial [Phycisphaerae bacterium]|nr:adenylate/guanylate cyclase domain-containing protein [Phycisphaerae bacterium]
AIHSIRLTAVISEDLEAISRTLLPVSEKIARVNVLVLEQGIELQRLIGAADGTESSDYVVEAESRLKESHTLVLTAFERTRALLDPEAEENEHGSMNAGDLLERIDDIEAAYNDFFIHGLKLIESRAQDDQALFATLIAKLDVQQDGIDASIVALRRHAQDVTNDALRLADQMEHRLLITNITLTTLAFVMGLGFAIIITRTLMRAVRNLVQGTEAIENGDLDTEVAVVSHDEIGRLTGSFNHMVGELRLKERIKDTFGKYVDPRIVTNLLESSEFSEPGGERREMTVLFIDLKGFTSISEALEPDDLVRMINSFFGHMTNAIADNGGVVDKFMGDAVMAYWGPPFSGTDDHASLACKAAFEAFTHLEKFRTDVRGELGEKADDLDIDLRIGVSTGDMIVGTIGSRVSMNYTVMGDPVNLGSRLEGASKAYGTHVLISERTRELAADTIIVREVDSIRVKGKHIPTKIYELVGLGADSVKSNDKFAEGLNRYRAQDWESAASAFQASLAENPADSVSRVYLDRIAHFRATPPEADWDGVWVFESK